jgi:hypothetical protein
MRSNRWVGIAAVVALWSGGALAGELTESRCIVLAEKSDGTVDTLPGEIAVLEPMRTSPAFSLTLPPGYAHASVMCGRSDIEPAEDDWKVLEAGYPLDISVSEDGKPDRILALESIEGRLQVRFVKGTMTDAEAQRLQARINQLQTAMQDAFVARKARMGTGERK